ncbi:uncharacterized protein LOC110861039 [Folsomia candida]|uniref:uncharacterized protein LOC110861039 n=1 Tax=Folsomia candida TaxID=158441 RepID=UPI000B908B25|nr:uncharacterized protein LOC110861039 [Folsomia candida]
MCQYFNHSCQRGFSPKLFHWIILSILIFTSTTKALNTGQNTDNPLIITEKPFPIWVVEFPLPLLRGATLCFEFQLRFRKSSFPPFQLGLLVYTKYRLGKLPSQRFYLLELDNMAF